MSEKKLAKGNDKAALNRRLKRIEGQVKGIQKMIEDDRYISSNICYQVCY